MRAIPVLGAIGNLLRKQIPAVGNSPVESDGSEVRAALALSLAPRPQAGDQKFREMFDDPKQAVVRPDRANLRLIVTLLGAQANELDKAREVVSADCAAGDTTYLADSVRQLNLAADGQNGPAI